MNEKWIEQENYPANDLLQLHYESDGAAKIAARFALYEFAKPSCDFEEKTIETLGAMGLMQSPSVMDLGTSDGHFLQLLRLRGFKGTLMGVEPSIQQVTDSKLWQPYEEQRIYDTLRKRHDGEHSDEFYKILTRKISTAVPRDIDVVQGEANQIPLPDKSMRTVTALFSFYHVEESRQASAFNEIKRVLDEQGVFILATSGKDNKLKHRIFEEAVAEDLGVASPALMNAGFTTERAESELPKHFNYVYRFLHSADMVINTSERIGAYLKSQRSLYDQYSPVPELSEFENALQRLVKQPLTRALIRPKGGFTDFIRRSMFICSDAPITPPSDFLRISTN